MDKQYLRDGSRLHGGRFEILSKGSAGGFGLTYRARDEELGCEVALKEYFPRGAKRVGDDVDFGGVSSDEARPTKAVIAESLSTAAVTHPAVARTFLTFEENNTAYIAMEWIEGRTLRDVTFDGDVTPELIRKVYLTVLDAALHFARAGFAHRDLTPKNIMIRDDHEAVVIDFGLARAVGPGYTSLTRTAAGTPWFAPDEQWDPHAQQDFRTDVFGLSASIYDAILGIAPRGSATLSLRDLFLADDPRVEGYDRGFLEVIDRGLAPSIGDRPASGGDVLELLELAESDLESILAPDVRAVMLLTHPVVFPTRIARGGEGEGQTPTPVTRFQRCLLQSFDTARFQPSEVKRRDGRLLRADPVVKVALARTEAVLNVLFGREIIVPAGQVAESPAFFSLFNEMMVPYLARREQIDRACTRQNLPEYRPMRLALEDPRQNDYVEYVEGYEYKGAPLVLLSSAGQSSDTQTAVKERVEGFKKLFLARQYETLESVIRQDGYADFARMVRAYFGSDAIVHADRSIPEVTSNDYQEVFVKRLDDEKISGKGIEDARAALPVVKEIESDLRQHQVAGFRGNWYLYQHRFGDVWPIARAYLDLRLFLTLARQYRVDHPILVSQEFEYGRFDHSLYLGPRFATNMDGPDENPLLELVSDFTVPVKWDEIFALYENDKFLRSLRRMNSHFFAEGGREVDDYLDVVGQHGEIINKIVGSILDITFDDGEVRIAAATDGARAITYAAYDPVGRGTEVRDSEVKDSMLAAFGGTPHDGVAVGTMTSDEDGSPIGTRSADAILHYFAKPYRLLADRMA